MNEVENRDTTAGISLFVRGRVCVVGEHSDWAGGLTTSPTATGGTCLIYTTQCGVKASVCHSKHPPTTSHLCAPRLSISKCSAASPSSTNQPTSSVTVDVIPPYSCELYLATLAIEATNPTNYYSYMCGGVQAALRYLMWKGNTNNIEAILPWGISIFDVLSDMPERRGFSSSATITVLAVKAVLSLVAASSPTTSNSDGCPSSDVVAAAKSALGCVGTCMELAWWGERLTGSLCGQMDQCVACTEHGFQLMSFSNKHSELCTGLLDSSNIHNARASVVELNHIAPPVSFYFVVADLKAGKDTRCILECLTDAVVTEDSRGDTSPTSRTTTLSSPLSAILDSLEELLLGGDDDSITTARDLIASLRKVNTAHSPSIFLRKENSLLVQLACVCITRGSVVGLGAVMRYYQALFDASLQHLCPELKSPKLHSILEDEEVRKLSVGGKGVGSQGDGSIQFLCATQEDQHSLHELLQTPQYDCTPFKFQL